MEIENENKKVKKTGTHKKWLIVGIAVICVTALVVAGTTLIDWRSFKEIKIILSDDYADPYTGCGNLMPTGAVSLPQYETEASTGYQNPDGTVTLDVYAAPIRFKNRDNQLQGIDCRLVNVQEQAMRDKGYIYTVAANDIQSYYPKNICTGIQLQNNDFNFTFGLDNKSAGYAAYGTQKNILGNDTNMVTYKNAFQNGVGLSVYPSTIGTNTEINFNKPPADNTFSFWLKTDVYFVSLSKGGYILMNSNKMVEMGLGNKALEVMGVIQAPLLKDANGQVSYHNTLSLDKTSDGQYTVTLTLDKEFLAKAQYPVKSYSTFEVFRDKEPDSATYSGQPNLSSYLSNYTVLGNSPDMGKGEIRVRYVFTKNFALQASRIVQSTYKAYNFSNNNVKDQLEMLTVLDDWCSLVTHWSDTVKYGDQTTTMNMDDNPIMSFDITKETQMWCGDTTGLAEHKGVLLRSTGELSGVWNIILSNDNALYNNRTEIILKIN